jgi:7-cyano-7-deazaguanine synthase
MTRPDDTAEPAVVLVSGGLDSTVLLHHVVRTLGHTPVYAVSFDYGQRHSRELACAAWQAQALDAVHVSLDLSVLGDVLEGATTLVEGGADVPDYDALDRDELDQPPTYVPNRNMILLSIVAAYAESQGVAHVFYGAQARDEYGYWDCTSDFVERINAVLALNRRTPVTVHAPFVNTRKSDAIQLGVELGVDFSKTWSCYRGGEQACGTCPTCVERLAAFDQAGVPDPLPYQH